VLSGLALHLHLGSVEGCLPVVVDGVLAEERCQQDSLPLPITSWSSSVLGARTSGVRVGPLGLVRRWSIL
jgi:hypothetical protein